MGAGSLTGGMVVSRALARYGSRTVFALAGASNTHLFDALDRDGFRIVGGRHETGSVSAADGYARITGRIGIALVIAELEQLADERPGEAFDGCGFRVEWEADRGTPWSTCQSIPGPARH